MENSATGKYDGICNGGSVADVNRTLGECANILPIALQAQQFCMLVTRSLIGATHKNVYIILFNFLKHWFRQYLVYSLENRGGGGGVKKVYLQKNKEKKWSDAELRAICQLRALILVWICFVSYMCPVVYDLKSLPSSESHEVTSWLVQHGWRQEKYYYRTGHWRIPPLLRFSL